MRHWDTHAESLLALARSAERVPSGARSRVKTSIMASIALSGAAGVGVSAVTGATAMAKLPAAVKAASSVVPFAAAAAGAGGPIAYLAPVTVGLALGLSALSPSEGEPARSPVVNARTPAGRVADVRPSATGRVVSSVTAALPELDVSEPDATEEMAPPPASVGKVSPAPSSIGEEASLLEHARLVLRQGDSELTLRLLDQHRQRFPNGALFFEALATRAVALCRQGRISEGRQILTRLETTTAGSPALPQVRHACHADGEGTK